MSRTRLYRIYGGIKARCNNPKCAIYYKYGARGVRICEEWSGDYGFINFARWALGSGYADNLTIDRIDAKGNYEPGNCRWATYEEQNTHLSMLKSNKSGIVGVSWSKKEQRWLAMISIKNHPVRIGSFKTKEDAAIARNRYIEKNGLPHQLSVVNFELEEKRFAEYTAQTAMF